MNTVQITLKMSPELRDRLGRAAEERMVSRSILAEALIREGMERLLPPEEVRWTGPPPEVVEERPLEWGPPGEPDVAGEVPWR